MNSELTKAIIYLLVGAAVMLTGMKMMSSALKKIAGKGLKNFFKRTKNNPASGMILGTSVTAIIQSSDATNAMVLGFINAGAMTVFQGLTVMLGAYIGTTVTGVLASFASLPISLYLLLLVVVGTAMIFIKNEKVQYIGEILTGLGLLFFGLAVMKDSFGNEIIQQACVDLFSSINNGVLLFLIGVVIAALIQSSSAITSIAIAMVGGGALPLNAGLYIALGASLGTIANTFLAAIGSNVNAKRATLSLLFVRILTSFVMLSILLISSSYGGFIEKGVMIFAIDGNPQLPLAMFTVFYNLIFMPLALPLLKPFIKLSEKIVKDKEQDKLQGVVKHIDDKMLSSPQIALMQVKKEIVNMYWIARQNFTLGFNRVLDQNSNNDKEIIAKEDAVDYLNSRITAFLIALSNKVDSKDDKIIGSYFHVINDIERIGDHAYNFYEMAVSMQNDELKFSEVAIKEMNEMNNIIDKMFGLALDIFKHNKPSLLNDLHKLESQTDELKNVFYTNHFNRVSKEECSQELTPYISSFITELERVADHLTNIGYSIKNPTGDEVNFLKK